jgi:hypothetical protein
MRTLLLSAILITILAIVPRSAVMQDLTVEPGTVDPEVAAEFTRLMQDQATGDCVLPCWWGLQPGQSTTLDVLMLLRETGIAKYRAYLDWSVRRYLLEGLDFYINLDPARNREDYDADRLSIADYYIRFWVQDGRLRSINMTFNGLEPISGMEAITLPYLVNSIAEQPEIYMGNRESLPVIDFSVIYPERGLWLDYRLDIPGSTWDEVDFCFNGDQIRRVEITSMDPHDSYFGDRYQDFVTAENINSFDERFENGITDLADALRSEQCLQTRLRRDS